MTGVSTGLTRRSKKLDPTGNPTGRSTRPVSISGAPIYEISGQVDRSTATETVDACSIPGRIKPKTIKTGSSVARGGAGGGHSPPPIGLPTNMQNKENTTFLALQRLSFALD